MIPVALFPRIVFYLACVGTVTSAIFCGLAVVAALRFAARKRRAEKEMLDFTPPISVLKPLHGLEPGLEKSLETFFTQKYPAPYEIFFCARHTDDEGLQLAHKVAARYPDQPVRFYACGEPLFPNPKMFSMAVLAQAATYSHFVTSDADARVDNDYLLQCVQALKPGHTVKGQQVELASCVYRGVTDPGASLFTKLDAMGKSVEMTSGVLVADMLSGTDFALGVTMILQRQAFADAGGYDDLGSFWAEDFVLGNRLANMGRGVEMSTHVIGLVVAEQGVKRSFRDQLRWMQSTRRSRPLGHLGTGLTFAMPFGLFGFVLEAMRGQWCAAFAFLGIAMANRILQAAVLLSVLRAKGVVWQSLLYPLRDALGGLIWLLSYLPADTRYHNTRFRIMPDGRLLKEDAEASGS